MTYQLREVHLPILPKGSPTLRILHFSDLHLTPDRKREISIIRSWVDLGPDLVISTGDFLGHRDAHDAILRSIEAVLAVDSDAPKTPDLLGKGSTQDLGNAIVEALR